MDTVNKVHLEFLQERSQIIGDYIIDRLRNDPIISRAVAIRIAKVVSETGELLTDEIYKALVHVLNNMLATQVASELGQQVGHALAHTMRNSAISSFSASLVHAFHSAIVKVCMKFASAGLMKTALAKSAGVAVAGVVVAAVVSLLATHLGANAAAHSAALLTVGVLVHVILAIGIQQAYLFPKNLAKDVAPKVRDVLAGKEFKDRNESALNVYLKETFQDGAKKFCKLLLKESELGQDVEELEETLAGKAKEAAKEMNTVAKKEGIRIYLSHEFEQEAEAALRRMF